MDFYFSDLNDQTTVNCSEKLSVPSINHILQNKEKQILINSTEAYNHEKKSKENRYVLMTVYLILMNARDSTSS